MYSILVVGTIVLPAEKQNYLEKNVITYYICVGYTIYIYIHSDVGMSLDFCDRIERETKNIGINIYIILYAKSRYSIELNGASPDLRR